MSINARSLINQPTEKSLSLSQPLQVILIAHRASANPWTSAYIRNPSNSSSNFSSQEQVEIRSQLHKMKKD